MEGEQSKEIPISEWPFSQTKREFDRLSRVSSPNPTETSRREAVRTRMNLLISEVDEVGGLEDVREDLKTFRQRLEILNRMKTSGELKDEHMVTFLGDVQDASRSARGMSDDEDETHKGVREHIYTQGLKNIKDNAAEIAPKEVPKNPEDQRKYVRGLIDRIELNALRTYDYQNTLYVNQIQEILAKLHPEVQREVTARLKLQDCFVLVREALLEGGDMREGDRTVPGGLFRQKQAELNSKGRLLEGADFHLLLREGLPGFKISEAWNKLEEAALLGKEIGKDHDGKPVVKKIFQEGTSKEAEDRICEVISKELGGDKNADKSVQLALRLAWATLEVSVWNDDIVGNDSLAEAIYFRGFREGKAQAGTNRGPDITVPQIEGFGSSYFRVASLPGAVLTPLYNPPELEIKRSKGGLDPSELVRTNVVIKEPKVKKGFELKSVSLTAAEVKYLRRIRAIINSDDPDEKMYGVHPEELDFLSLSPGDYGVYLSIRLPQIMKVKELLLQTDWKPTDMFRDRIESWISPLRFIDPDKYLGLRYKHILGALDSSFRNVQRAVSLGWAGREWKNVQADLARPLGRSADGRAVVSYLAKEEVAQIGKQLGLDWKLIKVDFINGAFGSKR